MVSIYEYSDIFYTSKSLSSPYMEDICKCIE